MLCFRKYVCLRLYMCVCVYICSIFQCKTENGKRKYMKIEKYDMLTIFIIEFNTYVFVYTYI